MQACAEGTVGRRRDCGRGHRVQRWIPGQLTLDSAALGWEGLTLKGYHYDSIDVAIPPMRDYI